MAVDPEAEAKLVEDAEKLYEEFGGNARRLSMVAAQFRRFAQGAQPNEIEVSGGVSAMTAEPFIRFAFGGDYAIQHKPHEARAFALTILEAAETAVSDAALFAWAREVADADESRAAQMVGHVRDFRRDHWGGPQESVPG